MDSERMGGEVVDGQEWFFFKENVRPLKGGRKVGLLNHALKANQDSSVKQSLLDNRRNLLEAIDKYEGQDPLQPWIECIRWVQESFPAGGDQSGLVSIYEQCVRSLWGDERYHNDLRYLKIWLAYAEQCHDPEVVCNFLYVNNTGSAHSLFYEKYAMFSELKNKMEKANEIYSVGVARGAQPLDKLETMWKCFKARATKANKEMETKYQSENESHLNVDFFGHVTLEDTSSRSFGTIIGGQQRPLPIPKESRRRPLTRRDNEQFNIFVDNKVSHPTHLPLSVHQIDGQTSGRQEWLGFRAERNKENKVVPSKWTSSKIPQKSLTKPTVPELEVFVDEDCNSIDTERPKNGRTLHLRLGDLQSIKRDIELLKKNPLMNFPKDKLPR